MAVPLPDDEIERRSKSFYDRELRVQLEAEHRDEFVAIEPISQNWFVGKSLREAARIARIAYPERVSFVIRIGHRAAVPIQ